MSKLKTENSQNGSSAIEAFFKRFRIRRSCRGAFDCTFEHGQLWVSHSQSRTTWSVVDAEGKPAINGFDFEQVVSGDESYLETGYIEATGTA